MDFLLIIRHGLLILKLSFSAISIPSVKKIFSFYFSYYIIFFDPV